MSITIIRRLYPFYKQPRRGDNKSFSDTNLLFKATRSFFPGPIDQLNTREPIKIRPFHLKIRNLNTARNGITLSLAPIQSWIPSHYSVEVYKSLALE